MHTFLWYNYNYNDEKYARMDWGVLLNMDNCFMSEAKIISNSAKDGTVKVKMATVGERNLNGFLLSNDESLKFKPNASYPLFFEHKTDMDNLIGFFEPIGVEGKDIMANAKITNPRAKELVSQGAINSASVTYEVEDYDYDDVDDTVIINSANLIELSLVLTPADPTAKILNSKTKNALMTSEGNKKMTDDQFKQLVTAISSLPEQIADAIKKQQDSSDTSDDKQGTQDGKDASKDNTASNSLNLDDLKKKWGLK